MTSQSQQILDAANALEEQLADLREIVNELRVDASRGNRPEAYTRLYMARRDLSRLVSSLGAGQPPAWRIRRIKDERKAAEK